VNFNECETKCFKNCSCVAYTHSNTSGAGNGCIMWFGDLIDIREQLRTLMGQYIFMRVPTSELGMCTFWFMVSPTSNSKENRYNVQASIVNLPLALVHSFEIYDRLKKKMKEAMHNMFYTYHYALDYKSIYRFNVKPWKFII